MLTFYADETTQSEEGPIKMIDQEQVPKEPYPLIEGFEWVTMDLTKDAQVRCTIRVCLNPR